ncbi:ABC transporter substrate-binding protein [Geofilum rhodophaeum]|uniref:ABC transporter substrate-binding protein n=1 Tax=Geofilum rhodophaeum TaxID=1965019 RepID=UPI000B5275B8|nr:ABC transporter substrate-binding protein [Geofilum rhodophaeum]
MKTKGNNRLLAGLILVLLNACSSPARSPQQSLGQTEIKYASGFRIEAIAGGTLIYLMEPADSTQVLARVALMEPGAKAPDGTTALELPLKRIVCLSSTYMGYFLELNARDKIVGVNSFRHLNDSTIRARILNGEILQVGKEGHFNGELLMALRPDVVFVSPYKTGGYEALQHLGLPLVPVPAYYEETPLARAEWLRLFGRFVSEVHRSDSLFAQTEKAYLQLKKLTASIDQRPTIFSGRLKGNVWYVPGGKSFYAHYFADAGASYLFADNLERGALRVDFEQVYQRAARADFWRIYSNVPGNYSLSQFAAEDHRYPLFDAFKNGQIIYCNIHDRPYYELGPVKPHWILADYIHHFHPQLLPHHQPFFYQKIN